MSSATRRAYTASAMPPKALAPAERHRGTPVSSLHGAAPVLSQVIVVVDRLATLLGRRLRVLDLGSEERYFARHPVARALVDVDGLEFPQSQTGCDAVIERLRIEQYDLVIACGPQGLIDAGDDGTSRLLSALAESAGAVVMDCAVSKPVPGQLSTWRLLAKTFAFTHELPPSPGQPYSLQRTVCFASNRYWLLDGEAGAFEQFKTESHSATCGFFGGTRRYYLGSGRLVKVYALDNPVLRAANLLELRGEVAFLRHPPKGFPAPKLLLAGERPDEGWLVRDLVEGKLLFDMMRDGEPYDAETVLRDVVSQLAVLEEVGLYHRDIRPWNVIVAPNGRATLIDYGAVSSEAMDCDVPRNPFAAFLVFAREVFGGASSRLHGACLPRFDPDALPRPYRAAFWSLLQAPPQTWRFDRLLQDIRDPEIAQRHPSSANAGFQVLLSATDDCAAALDRRITSIRSELTQTVVLRETKIEELQRSVRAGEAREAALETREAAWKAHEAAWKARETALKDQCAQLNAEANAARQREAHLTAQLASLLQSASWRVTAPLRMMKRLLLRRDAL